MPGAPGVLSAGFLALSRFALVAGDGADPVADMAALC